MYKGKNHLFNITGDGGWKIYPFFQKSMFRWRFWVMKGEKAEQTFTKHTFYFCKIVQLAQNICKSRFRIVSLRACIVSFDAV